MQKTLKIFSQLLLYPSQELQQNLPEFTTLLAADATLPSEYVQKFTQWLTKLIANDLISWQEEYVALFDTQVSLYLFEYLHGQSRDRGQAMVNLSEYYQQHNFSIKNNELPDYLPLILEFMSYQKPVLQQEFLGDTLKIINQIGQKLRGHASDYALIGEALAILIGVIPEKTKMVIPIHSHAEIDNNWQEPPVTFAAVTNASPCACS